MSPGYFRLEDAGGYREALRSLQAGEGLGRGGQEGPNRKSNRLSILGQGTWKPGTPGASESEGCRLLQM